MNFPTRTLRGRKQIQFEGVWCDVPHGYNPSSAELTKLIEQRQMVREAKRVLGDEPDTLVFDGKLDISSLWSKKLLNELTKSMVADFERVIIYGTSLGVDYGKYPTKNRKLP